MMKGGLKSPNAIAGRSAHDPLSAKYKRMMMLKKNASRAFEKGPSLSKV
jgi:hypothetical protein